MAYLRIDADEKRMKVDMEGTPLSLMGILGTTAMECLEKIVEDIPAPFAGETALAFMDTLRLHAMCKWGGREKSDKTAEDKQPEEPKKPEEKEPAVGYGVLL